MDRCFSLQWDNKQCIYVKYKIDPPEINLNLFKNQ